MMATTLDAVSAWLKSSYGVQAPQDWLTACVEWIQEENTGQGMSAVQLQPLVFEQWLLADLRELGAACVPADLADHVSTHVTGPLAFQVESMMDVGFPLYGQLQKLKGTLNANTEVSADQPLQPGWEPKQSRMMLMKMTDGQTDVQGMEYRPIQALHGGLQPGFKVVVHGEVKCRRGVLLLTGENLQILGGEVDSLVEANPPVAVLERAMEVSAANNGKHEKMQFSGCFINKQDFNCGEGKSCKMEPSTQQSSSSYCKPQTSTKMMGQGDRSWSNSIKKQPSTQQQSLDDEWEEDLDYGHILNTIEEPMEGNVNTTQAAHLSANPAFRLASSAAQRKAVPGPQPSTSTATKSMVRSVENNIRLQTSNNNSGRQQSGNVPGCSTSAGSKFTGKSSGLPKMKEEFVDDFDEEDLFDDDLLCDVDASSSKAQVESAAGGFGSGMTSGNSSSVVKTPAQSRKSLQRSSSALPDDHMWDDDDDFVFAEAEAEIMSQEIPVQSHVGQKEVKTKPFSVDQNHVSASTKNASGRACLPDNSNSSHLPVISQHTVTNFSPAVNQISKDAKPPPPKQRKLTSMMTVTKRETTRSPSPVSDGNALSVNAHAPYNSAVDENSVKQETDIIVKQENVSSQSTVYSTETLQKSISVPAAKLERPETVSVLDARSGNCEFQKVERMDVEPCVETATPFAAHNENVPKAVVTPFTSSQENEQSSTPCQTLSDVQNWIQSTSDVAFATFTVNGYITTLTDRLRSGSGDVWSLSCRITDGTATMNVALSDTVLVGLIGFTAQRSFTLRQEARQNPQAKDFLTQSLRKCQHTLEHFTGLIELRAEANNNKPVVTNMVQMGTKKR